jgi:hypothetical protein
VKRKKMNNKKGKGVIGITLAAIMIASIFAVIVPTGAEDVGVMNPGAIAIYKETYPNPDAKYNVGETIDYKIKVDCPDDAAHPFTVDVYDKYPNGTDELIEKDLTLMIGENKTYFRSYTVEMDDRIMVDGKYWVVNFANATGETDVGVPVYAETEAWSQIMEVILKPPVFDFSWMQVCNRTIRFVGYGYDEDGYIVDHTWDFGDGNITGPISGAPGTIIHQFPAAGDYTVKLSGYDNDSQYGEVSKEVVDVKEVCPHCKIRVYGYENKGAGDTYVLDPETDLPPENPPYTDPIGPFYPQHEQAPEKDFITFNPIKMQHRDYDWDNDGNIDYVYKNSIKADRKDAEEKEFFRMWYEPEEWIKDENANGKMDGGDIVAPAIKQEFTFMFLNTDEQPISAPTGTSRFLVPMASGILNNGIDSFDADGDGAPDPVVVCSEANLGDMNSDGTIDSLDIDGDGGVFETLSPDGAQLTGDETLVLRLDPKTVSEGDRIQFFDFEVEVVDTTEAGRAILNIYYKGNPDSMGDELIGTVNLRANWLPGNMGASFATFERGGVNTADRPRGPGFVGVVDVDWEDDTATIIVGRMFGNTWANIGAIEQPYGYQKHFYVDGVLYNVVAIMTEGVEELKYVTFRVKLPKVPVWIEQHSEQLLGWDVNELLPVMPQYNMNHCIAQDVQSTWTYDKIGPLMNAPALWMHYNEETVEPRFHGELKEILGEPGWYPWQNQYEEGWFIEHFQMIPWEYTEFQLPDGHGKYLFTSAFEAPESDWELWDGTKLDSGTGTRLKFWYEDCSGPLYIDKEDESLRIYGYDNRGAGDTSVRDPETCLRPENPPYTDPIAPFYPQHEQAPRKDFITFNPIKMEHRDYDWDNDGTDDYVYKNNIKADRMNANEKEFFRMWYEPAEWIKDENANGEMDGGDIVAPTIKQEFTFMFLNTYNEPISAPTGTSKFLVPMASRIVDNGIDSFDADGDGAPDPVVVCSEANLGDMNSDGTIDSLDIDGDGGVFETLSPDGAQLTGDETLVLRLNPKTIKEGDRIQFFDFEVEVVDTTEAGRAILNIYYKGNPDSMGDELIGTVNLKANWLPASMGASFATFERGGVNTESSPRGPGFVGVVDVDWEDDTATIIVGRMFGNTWANIGAIDQPYGYQKHFYVDGVLYNVVAIMTEGNEELKYVTFRVKLTKEPVWIEQHSEQLLGWYLNDKLPVMPQYNMNHCIAQDVQTEWTYVKVGPLVNAPELNISYVKETREPRFKGELKEILGEPGWYPWGDRSEEGWFIEHFETIPRQYTAFKLPEGHGLYLVTSAFEAPESEWELLDGTELDSGTGSRLKFWYNPADNTDIYVNRYGGSATEPETISEYYDNGDGTIDLDEIIDAIMDYLNNVYPFGFDGRFDLDDLIDYIMEFLNTV